MTTPQSGILPDANQHSLFLLFRRRIGRRASPRIKKLLAQLPERAAQLAATDPAAHFGAVIAFGTNIWNELWEDRPHSLRAFPRISGAVHQAPTTEVDVLLHLRSERYDFLHEFADKLVPELGEWLDMLEVVHGFRYHDGRDLTGFVDGTGNPDGQELKLLRHSMPYGIPGGERGMYFCAYSRDPAIFERMLSRMVTPIHDGRVDHLLNFTRAVSGAAFFAPSQEKLAALAK